MVVMDKLITYLNSLDKAERAAFAKRCSTSEGYLRKARSSGQKLRWELCLRIEQESNGAVTRKDLRDDWAEVWPELAETSNGTADRTAASDDTQPPAGTADRKIKTKRKGKA
jgi:DNA-binding transcriptional regulator YdaS (Cro superfamily)